MKTTILVLLVIIFSRVGIYQEPPLLGLHGSSSLNVLNNTDAQVVRYGFTDYQIKNVIQSGDSSAINNILNIHDESITQVVFLIFPEDSIQTVGADFERIPYGIDSLEVMSYLDTFITAVGTHIDWIQISQEPFGVTPYDTSQYSISDILGWWRTLAGFIRDKSLENPQMLGHLKITTGGITGIRGVLENPQSPVAPIIDSIILFAENYCDAIDLHLNTTSIESGRREVNYIQTRTNLPLTITEWSQANVARESGWLNAINTVWTDPQDPFYGLSNKTIIDSAYSNQMSLTDWQSLVSTAPYTENFIPDFYAMLDSHCIKLACYAGVLQYGEPNFDWRALYTNKVTESTHYNQPFYNDYTELSQIVGSGQFVSNCNPQSANGKVDKKRQITIYPNPAVNVLNIKLSDRLVHAQLKILNSDGKIVKELSNLTGEQLMLDIAELIPGIYFVQITGKEVMYTGKFNIQ